MHRFAFSAALVAACLLAGPASAAPGHDHGHDHGHGQEAGGPDLRLPFFGGWQVDVAGTVEADPALKKAAAGDPRAHRAAEELFGKTALHFSPDGRAVARFPDGVREGIYTVEADGDHFVVRIVDAHANRMHTAEYHARLDGDRLRMQHDEATLVFVRKGAVGAAQAPDPTGAPPGFVGRWRVDVEQTLARDARLRTMTAEQQKAARDTARTFLSKFVFEWRADGTASIGLGGAATQENRWRLLAREGSRHTLEAEFVEAGRTAGKETVTLDIEGGRMRMTMKGQTLVLVPAQ